MQAELTSQSEESLELSARQDEGQPRRLPRGWLCGRDCEIVARPGDLPMRIELVLMHPALGIALLDTEGREEISEDREGALRARLAQARFSAIFGGRLPIIQGSVTPAELPSLPEILTREFQSMPPLTLGGGEAWISTVSRILVPRKGAWTDELESVPHGTPGEEGERAAKPLDPAWWDDRSAGIVPLRRAAPSEDMRTGFERLPRPRNNRRRVPWLPLGVAGLGALVLAATELAWVSAPPPANTPAAPSAAPAEARPAEARPIMALPRASAAASVARPEPPAPLPPPPSPVTAQSLETLPVPPLPPEPVLSVGAVEEPELPLPPPYVAPPPRRRPAAARDTRPAR
jgi:hypothetical protein